MRATAMRNCVLIFALGLIAVLALGFSLGPPGYVPPPSLSQVDSYRIATLAIGQTTNSFHCIWTNGALSWAEQGDWSYVFSSTNGHTKTVFIYDHGDPYLAGTNLFESYVFDDLSRE